ncbi:hypothetical protein JCM1840_007431 [Sporobolomyces johnsonii]
MVESGRMSASVQAGRRAMEGGVFIHMVEEDDEKMRPSLEGKKGWFYNVHSRNDKHVIQPASLLFIVHRYLPLHEHPSVDLVFDEKTIQKNSADHWILAQPSDQPLSSDQLRKLHLSSLHPDEPRSPLVFACLDPGRSQRGTAELMRGLRHSIDMSIEWRRPWRRSRERAATGTAVGLGLRMSRDSQPLGYYQNLKRPPPEESQTTWNLSRLLMGERSAMAYPLFTAGAVLPGLLDFERSLTHKFGLPPVSRAGTSTTGSSTRNYQSCAHVEQTSDAVFTFGACFGSPEPPPRGTASFTLPAIDNGRGVAFENAEGVVMVFQGARHMHTQANPLPFTDNPPLETAPPIKLKAELGSDKTRLCKAQMRPRRFPSSTNLSRLLMGKRSAMVYPLLATGAVLPGLLAFKRSLDRKVALHPVSLAGTSTTGCSTRNYQSFAHVEQKDDAVFTFGACFGSPSPPPHGTASFTLPAINNGRGVAFENGEGIVMVFQGTSPGPDRQPPFFSRTCPTDVDPVLYQVAHGSAPTLSRSQQYRGMATFTKKGMLKTQERLTLRLPIGTDNTLQPDPDRANGISIKYEKPPLEGGFSAEDIQKAEGVEEDSEDEGI